MYCAEFFQKMIAKKIKMRWEPGQTPTLFPYRVKRETVNGRVIPTFTFKGLLNVVPCFSMQALIIEDCFFNKCKAWRSGEDLVIQLPPK